MARKYRCIYCQRPFERKDLINHIDRKHADMIPSGYPAERIVFDICNNKDVGNGHGTCSICKAPTPWDEKSGRYKVYCSDKCKQIMRDNAVKNMIKVHGKSTLLNDIEHQEKMLAARKISGTYKFTDGGVCTYTGSYERKLLEFMDKILDVSSEDLVAPGPVIEYEFKGEKRKYITDFYYIPYNLIIEVKDGGKNPNKVVDQSEVRQKTFAKEDSIIKLGKYNYLRLTDNDFLQLLEIFADLKENTIAGIDDKIYHINENCGNTPMVGFDGQCPQPVQSTHPVFITHYRDDATCTDQYYMSNDIMSDKVIMRDSDTGKLKKTSIRNVRGKGNVFKYVGNKNADILTEVANVFKSGKAVHDTYLPDLITECTTLVPDQLYCSPLLEEVDFLHNGLTLAMESAMFEGEFLKSGYDIPAVFSVISPELYDKKNALLEGYDDIRILQDVNGYFAINNITGVRTSSYKDFDRLTRSKLDSINV